MRCFCLEKVKVRGHIRVKKERLLKSRLFSSSFSTSKKIIFESGNRKVIIEVTPLGAQGWAITVHEIEPNLLTNYENVVSDKELLILLLKKLIKTYETAGYELKAVS